MACQTWVPLLISNFKVVWCVVKCIFFEKNVYMTKKILNINRSCWVSFTLSNHVEGFAFRIWNVIETENDILYIISSLICYSYQISHITNANSNKFFIWKSNSGRACFTLLKIWSLKIFSFLFSRSRKNCQRSIHRWSHKSALNP